MGRYRNDMSRQTPPLRHGSGNRSNWTGPLDMVSPQRQRRHPTSHRQHLPTLQKHNRSIVRMEPTQTIPTEQQPRQKSPHGIPSRFEAGNDLLDCSWRSPPCRGGGINENIMHHSIATLFESFHMSNLIFDMHDPSTTPSTYFRNTEGKIMDGIWGTPGLHVAQCGYLESGDVPGDHSLLWADISYSSALGHDPPWPSKASAQCLKLGCTKTTE